MHEKREIQKNTNINGKINPKSSKCAFYKFACLTDLDSWNNLLLQIGIQFPVHRSKDSSVSIVSQYEPDDVGFKSRQKQGISLFSKTSWPSQQRNQPPIQWVQGFFPRVKQLRCELHHTPPSTVNGKNEVQLYLCSPCMPPWHGQDSSMFYLLFYP